MKKRFKFRLQRVLDFRNSLKKEQAQQLARENARLRAEQEALAAIVEAHEQSLETTAAVRQVADLKQVRDYGQRLQKAFVEQRETVAEAEQAAEEAREVYIQKAVDAAAFESLKERKLQNFREELRRHERKELDKLVVQRHRTPKAQDGNPE